MITAPYLMEKLNKQLENNFSSPSQSYTDTKIANDLPISSTAQMSLCQLRSVGLLRRFQCK